MTTVQIEEAIALHVGWTRDEHKSSYPWRSPAGTGFERPPPYARSLDRMHDAEKGLPDAKLNLFEQELGNVVSRDFHAARSPKDITFHDWHATARQRAEAFLRTVGKWEV